MEDRSGTESEGAVLGIDDGKAEDVGGQEIGRELDAPEMETQDAGESEGEGGLADAGKVLEEEVTPGEHARHGELDDALLAEHDAVDGFHDVPKPLLRFFHASMVGPPPPLVKTRALRPPEVPSLVPAAAGPLRARCARLARFTPSGTDRY